MRVVEAPGRGSIEDVDGVVLDDSDVVLQA